MKPPWYKNGGIRLIGWLVFLSFWAGVSYTQSVGMADDIHRLERDVRATHRIGIRIATHLSIDVSDLEAE